MNAVLLLLIFIVVVVTGGILQLCGHGLSYGDPRLLWISIPLLLFYSFNEWKDKRELLKRCILASPFALLMGVLLKVIGFEFLISCLGGALLFFALTKETTNWKRHYTITLAIAVVLSIAIAIIKDIDHVPNNTSNKYIAIGKIYLVMGCAFVLLVFYEGYSTWLSRSQKEPALRPLAVKSIKLAGVIFLALVLLTVSNFLCEHYKIGFAISFGFSVLIALGLWGVCKLFDIKNPAFSDVAERRAKKILASDKGKTTVPSGCDCCGKKDIPKEFLFKIDSGQRVCAHCLKEMEQERTI